MVKSKSTSTINPLIENLFSQVENQSLGKSTVTPLSAFDCLTVLNFALKRKLRDQVLLGSVSKMISDGKITQINTLTNIMYVFAKFNYIPSQKGTLETVSNQLIGQKEGLDLRMVSRNMWHFYQLNFYDKELFDIFCEVITKNENSKIGHKDTANALQSLAYFEHLHFDAMGLLIKNTIENCNQFPP